MNGSIFKVTSIFLILLVLACLPMRSIATEMTDDSRIFNTKLGCMACHQGNVIPNQEIIKKKTDRSPIKNQIKTTDPTL